MTVNGTDPTAAEPVKLVVVNGCSYAYGTELADKRHTWGRVVADHLGVPFASLAASGGGNRRLVRTTLMALDRLTSEHGCTPSNVLFLGSWTVLNRAEFFDPTVEDKGGRNGGIADDVYWQRLGSWRISPTKEKAELYYSSLHHPRGDVYNFLVDYALLESFLRGRGYQYRFVLAKAVLPEFDELPHELLAHLDERRLLGGFRRANAMSFEELVGHLPTGKNKHPLREAHEEFALRHLLPWLRSERQPAGSPR